MDDIQAKNLTETSNLRDKNITYQCYWKIPTPEIFKDRLKNQIKKLLLSLADIKYFKDFYEKYKNDEEEMMNKFCQLYFLLPTDYPIIAYIFKRDNFINKKNPDKINYSFGIRIPDHPNFYRELNIKYPEKTLTIIGDIILIKGTYVFVPNKFILNSNITEKKDYEYKSNIIFSSYDDGINFDYENFFDKNILENAPCSLSLMKEKMNEWKDFLKWQYDILQHNKLGVKYFDYFVDLKAQEITFFVAASNKDILNNLKSELSKENISIYTLKESTDEFDFLPLPLENIEDILNSNKKNKKDEDEHNVCSLVVRFKSFHKLDVTIENRDCNNLFSSLLKNNLNNFLTEKDFTIQKTSSAITYTHKNTGYKLNYNHQYAFIRFSINEIKSVFKELKKAKIKKDKKNEQFYQNDEIPDDNLLNILYENTFIKEVLDKTFNLQEQGFISSYDLGSIKLAERHLKTILKIEEDKDCFNPNLSNYLFNIQEANIPMNVITTDSLEYLNNDLNQSQKEAVCKILSIEDIGLIQGPPGTGKTTVIAEAIYQLNKNNQKVLLSSQSHDAIDNALARLKKSPEIIAVRLASKNKNGELKSTDDEYLPNHIVKNFYENIKNSLNENYISKMENNKNSMKEFTNWLKNAEILQNTLQYYKNFIDNKEIEFLKTQKEIKDILKNKEQLYNNLTLFQYKKEFFKNLIEFLDNALYTQDIIKNFYNLKKNSLDKDVISNELNEFYDLLLLLQKNIKLKLDNSLVDTQHPNYDKFNSFIYLYKRIFEVFNILPKLKTDLNYLSHNKNFSKSIDPNLEYELDELNIKKDKLTDELLKIINDPNTPYKNSLTEELQKISRRIKYLKNNNGASLKKEIYNRFTDADIFYKIHNEKEISDIIEILNNKINELEKNKNVFQNLLEKYKLLINYEFTGINENILDIECSLKIEADKLSVLQNINTTLQNELFKYKNIQQKYSEEEINLLKELPNYDYENLELGMQYVKQQLDLLSQQNEQFDEKFKIAQLAYDLLNYDKRINQDEKIVQEELLPYANVVALSCNENPYILKKTDVPKSYSYVIIDEVSKAMPVELLAPLMKAPKVILVGDHRQLPPIFHNKDIESTFEDIVDEDEKEVYIRYKKLATASLFKEMFENANEKIKQTLNIQFRMHPAIMNSINMFYEGRLICGNPELPREHFLEFKLPKNIKNQEKLLFGKDDHFLWIDTTCDEFGNIYRSIDNKNELEAKLIAKTIYKINQELSSINLKEKISIGVVSFYFPQISTILDEIKHINKGSLNFKNIIVDVNSVIRYQGKERDIILVSLAKNYGKNNNKIIKDREDKRANIARFEYLNVAMSRAKNLLIVFGARNLLENREIFLPSMDSNKPGTKSTIYKSFFNKLDLSKMKNSKIYTTEDFIYTVK